MKKFFFSIVSVVLLNIILISCSKNGVDDSISGLYVCFQSVEEYEYAYVYNFINGNAVINYSTVKNSTDGWMESAVLEQIPGHPGWYYSSSSKRQYTYVISENKIFISDGTILTINSDGTLVPDGYNIVYKKW